MWTGPDISVRTVPLKTPLPKWIKRRINITKEHKFFAFEFESCVVNQTGKTCESGKQLPLGARESGIWVFSVDGNQLACNVYYTYKQGGQRILEQVLTKR